MRAAIYKIESRHSERHPRPKQAPVVLVVDDEPAVLDMVHDVLAEEGFTVMAATDGRSALALAVQTQPDLVITDLMMPGMNGRTLCMHLAKDPRTKRTPVMLMSAAYRPQSDDRFAAVIAKPFELDDLLQTIESQIPPASTPPC